MDNAAVDFDLIEDIVDAEVSDETLEAAGSGQRQEKSTYSILRPFCV